MICFFHVSLMCLISDSTCHVLKQDIIWFYDLFVSCSLQCVICFHKYNHNTVNEHMIKYAIFLNDDNNNNVHLSCAHQRPERSHDTY